MGTRIRRTYLYARLLLTRACTTVGRFTLKNVLFSLALAELVIPKHLHSKSYVSSFSSIFWSGQGLVNKEFWEMTLPAPYPGLPLNHHFTFTCRFSSTIWEHCRRRAWLFCASAQRQILISALPFGSLLFTAALPFQPSCIFVLPFNKASISVFFFSSRLSV